MRDRDYALLLFLLATSAAGNGRDDRESSGILTRFASRAIGAVVDIVDPDAIIDRVGVNAPVIRTVQRLADSAMVTGTLPNRPGSP
jgi:hypothetical protein